jgi:hypothetical protein
MRKFLGLVVGVATQVLFAFTVWHLFRFLKGDAGGGKTGYLWIDAVLSVSFGVLHSALLYPTVREFLTRWIAAPFYGLFYCVVTCVGLLALFAMWATSSTAGGNSRDRRGS